MKIKDFHQLETISTNKKTINDFINTLPKSTSIEDVLETLRISGACFNIHNTNQLRTFKKTIANIEAKFPLEKEKISSFVNTLNNLDTIVGDFFSLRSAMEVEKIPKSRQIITFIIAVEVLLGSTIEYTKGISLRRIKDVYPFVVTLFDEKNQRIAKANERMDQIYEVADSIAGFTGSILKFLKAGDGDIGKVDATVSMKQIKIAREHVSLYDIWATLLDLEQSWKFAGSKIISKNENMVVELENENFLHSKQISFERFLSQKTKWNLDFHNFYEESKSKVNSNASKLPPEEFISKDESYYALAVGEFLETNGLNEKCLNVSLAEWIRAYTIVQLESLKHLEERFKDQRVRPLKINNWTILQDKAYWINLFIERGISNESAEIILNNFIFTNDSKDLLDCPFISHNNDIIVIPSIGTAIDPSMSLVSLLTRNNANISFKGTGLEQRILSKLNDKGIKAATIKRISGNDTYECDVAFTLNNDLFFIELKAFGQPTTIREYYNLLIKLFGEHYDTEDSTERSATEQLNRIAGFYENNLNMVREELKLSSTWMPKNIYKIILTTAKLGDTLFVDDCFIADTSVFLCFLDRTPPGITIGKRMLRPKHPDFEGDITSEKLVNVLSNPPQIELYKTRVRKSERTINLHSKTLTYPSFNDMLGNILQADHKTLNILGIDEKDLTEIS